ncbi:SDR family NAD(P)-dependent oxidoreductase [Peribacillus butanolivorans]|uniref:3-oxoacyl-ACP reductase n=1 Tax=Peribacillus butanolivorans TaxID=421767 RepID=A0AAX0S5C9_9BACI|nr:MULTISPECIES: glucose 1-dehydrogenase [Peribacillus]AXN38168.1 SDR family NAD(P)-dependent oxidoreductase [Peribacillus butanolivorans]KON70713.1 3-oxoacyl-ACP reductase [Peribacillus butanolivorans]MBK5443303.1 glucose 1-dehydrogenase [Peribacillus sp. TH24]MCO0597743.1 glucose 1-dehydrogenase [Peribacillus butanolivorans]PEJ34164.1 3-oxoacyl-ACP reductase [Peribacillus butanolivorans]
MSKLKNRTALVTGGSRGIGAAIVMRLAEEGANVAINYTSPGSFEKANALKEKVEKEFHIQAIVVKANVGVKEEVDQMIDQVEKELGSVEILVNNAGIAPFEPFLSLSEKTWDDTYQTNVKSIFLTTQRAAKKMIENKYGKVINITSTASVLVTSPVIPHYISSKAAASHLTKALAIELGKYNINVNAVGPSTVATDMCDEYLADPQILAKEIEANPMKRLGTEKQIGDSVVFLASDEAVQINGHLLMVDGGLTVKAAQPEDHMNHEQEVTL